MPSLISDPSLVRRILVCQQRQLGDLVLASPAIAMLHEHFPQAEIHVLTEKKCVSILEHNPHVHTIWAIDKKKLSTLFAALRWYRMVGKQGFDIVIDFQQLPRTRCVSFFADAPIKLTFTPPLHNRWVYTHWCDQTGGYSAHSKASILRMLGIELDARPPQLFISEAEKQAAQAMLADCGLRPEHRLISLDPTHRRVTRLWPARHYAKLIDLAYEQDPSLRFLPSWGPGEEEDIRTLVSYCVHPEAILLTPRMLSLREMAACIAEATMHVGNCSAPRHMAVALGTPTFIILGSTSGEWTFPSAEHCTVAAELDCQPCNKDACGQRRCLENLAPKIVYEYFAKHLALHGRKA